VSSPSTPLAFAEDTSTQYIEGEEAARAKRRRHVAYYGRQIPVLRLLGMVLLSLVVLLHNIYILGSFAVGEVLRFAVASLVYAAISWAISARYVERWTRFDLGTFFMALDVLWFAYAIRVSGGDRSFLVFLLLIRVADQTNTTFRRVLWFLQLSALSYLGVLLLQGWIDERPPRWTVELAKLAALYLTGVYIATTARTAELLRRRTTEAMRMARSLVEQLRAQSESLERARAQAEQASRAKTEFLANVGHELRTPLTGVMGFTDLVLDSELSAEQREHLETAKSCSHKLLGIVDQLLDLARLQGQAEKLAERPFHLGELIDGLVLEVAPLAREKGLALSLELAPEARLRLLGDPAHLRQVLLGLLQNAVKFTPAGSVTLAARISGREGDTVGLELSVRDTGIGIPRDKQQMIFEAFSQVEGSARRRHGGSGLGLALARRIVDLMQGRLSVQSEPGQGATFLVSLHLPLAG
jgi:signal transduction histidine kinase